MGGAFHFGGFHMDFPIRKPARRAEPGKRAERSDGPLFAPLPKVCGLLTWASADPKNKPGYVCGLVSATAEAVLSAMKNGRPGGWIFVQENFIRAVLAIRDMNVARGTAYTDRDLEERFPAAWSRMADAVETCARVVPRPCAGVRRIPRDVLGCPAETPEFGWSRPIRGEALQGLFDYCLETAKAALTSPTDRATVEMHYKGVVNVPLNVTQSLSRLEAGQGETHRLLQTTDEKAEARHRETLAAIAANGAKLDVLIGRSTDPVISTSQMASMCGVDPRIVEYWEQRLKDPEHKSGRQPPEGYTLATRCDSGRAKAFADTYKSNRAFHAASGKPKRISFDENRDKPDTSFADSLDSGAMDK